jgi:arylsulfatase
MNFMQYTGLLLGSSIAAASVLPAWAQQVELVKPDPEFKGVVAPRRADSRPDWPERVKAPNGAPNVVLILIDDVGFGMSSTFGGPALTPQLDKLAKGGLRYNEFHVNSLCSPTRAALLSGRNDHEIGIGNIEEIVSGYPGYNGIWPKSAASIAEVLKENGYSTAAIGKWHDTPYSEVNPVGPFDHWPTGLGFEYFYGFQGGEDSQWNPQLYRGTTPVEPDKTPEQGYNLNIDLANNAIDWLHQHDAVSPDKPFFLYLATGAIHAPHHVPKEWIAKYKGQFDQGWDKLREQTFERQKKLGVIPANAELTERLPGLPAWDSLSPEKQKVLSREAEVYAAFLSYTDAEVGRVLDAIHEEGQGDNTLVLYIVGDNGPSAEGGADGTDANIAESAGAPHDFDLLAKHADGLGGPDYDNHVAAAWAWAMAAPFKGTKQDSAHLGGTRDPLIVSWPARIKDAGGLRSQFSHVTDIAPTIYEAAGVQFPDTVNGIKQLPLEGKSISYTWDHPEAKSTHTVQYFEMLGNRGIYKDGWWAGSPNVAPWELFIHPEKFLADPSNNKWELYNLDEDFSQAHDLADKYPDKLKELIATFDSEARRNNVYPLAAFSLGQPSPIAGRKDFVYREGVDRLPPYATPELGGVSHRIVASVVLPKTGGEGVILADGGTYGGYTLFVKGGHVVYEANVFGRTHLRIVSADPVPTGKVEIAFDYVVDPNAPAVTGWRSIVGSTVSAGTGTLSVNGKAEGSIHFEQFGGFRSSIQETLDVGKDLGSAVSTEYKGPFPFTGKIDTVKIHLQ